MDRKQAGKAMDTIQQAIARAIQALEELEAAISAGDHRKIGARLFELRQALQEASREAQ